MAKKINWIKARVIDPKHPKFGQVVDCCRVPDTRFFGNRYQIKNARHLVFGDQLTLLKDGELINIGGNLFPIPQNHDNNDNNDNNDTPNGCGVFNYYNYTFIDISFNKIEEIL